MVRNTPTGVQVRVPVSSVHGLGAGPAVEHAGAGVHLQHRRAHVLQPGAHPSQVSRGRRAAAEGAAGEVGNPGSCV